MELAVNQVKETYDMILGAANQVAVAEENHQTDCVNLHKGDE